MQLTLILDNIRSAQNVGSITRSAAAFGVSQIFTCGVTPYPKITGDKRLPHVIENTHNKISKTSLGAEKHITFTHYSSVRQAISDIKDSKAEIYALEQAQNSLNITDWAPNFPCALVLGNEVGGVSHKTLQLVNNIVEIPLPGSKSSLNVAVAAGIALEHAALKALHQN